MRGWRSRNGKASRGIGEWGMRGGGLRWHRVMGLPRASSSGDMRPAGAGVEVLIRYVTRASERLKVRNRLYERVMDVLHTPHVVISPSQPSKLAAAVLAAEP